MVDLLIEGAPWFLDVTLATAHAWIDETAMAEIRAKLPPISKHGDAAVVEFEEKLQVGRHAIAAVARHPKGLPVVLRRMPLPEGEIGEVSLTSFDNYGSFLAGLSRPMAKGRNTRALHAHRIEIEGLPDRFLALGSKHSPEAAGVIY